MTYSSRSLNPTDKEAPREVPVKPPRAPSDVEPTNMLGVFGLSVRTSERDLRDEFGRVADVEKVVVVYDQRSGRSRGFGFITMRSNADAKECIEKLNGITLHGRAIRVDYSATHKPHEATPGQYMGPKRPLLEKHYSGGGSPYYEGRKQSDHRDLFDDRRQERCRDLRRERYESDIPHRRTRAKDDDYDVDYGYFDRRRSPSPCRVRYSISSDRRRHRYETQPHLRPRY